MHVLLGCPVCVVCLVQDNEKVIAKLLRRLKELGWLKTDVSLPHRLTIDPTHAGPDFLQTVIQDRAPAIQEYLALAWTRFSRDEKVSCRKSRSVPSRHSCSSNHS